MKKNNLTKYEEQQLMERIIEDYWWNKRSLIYRMTHNKKIEQEILTVAFESYLKE